MNKNLLILCVALTLCLTLASRPTENHIQEVRVVITQTLTPSLQVTSSPTAVATKPSFIKDIPLAPELQEYIWYKCNENNLNYEQVLALLGLESGYDINLVHLNEDGSKDYGLAQINNSKSNMEWFTELSGHKDFDPMNPYHAVDACVGGLSFYKKYWASKGIDDIRYTLNSYNMGLGGYKHYLRTKEIVSRGYDREITKRENKIK